jgi:hypothetical protein
MTRHERGAGQGEASMQSASVQRGLQWEGAGHERLVYRADREHTGYFCRVVHAGRAAASADRVGTNGFVPDAAP